MYGGGGSGLLTTAGKLVFGGDNGGNFVAWDAVTGTPIWHTHIGDVTNPPMTYMLDGRQVHPRRDDRHALRVRAVSVAMVSRRLDRRVVVLGPVVALLAAAAGACRADAPPPPAPPQRVYVSNETAGTIAVIDPATGNVLATIPVGKRPRGLRVSRDGKQLYVALSGSPIAPPGVDESTLPPADRSADGIAIVDIATRKIVRTIHSGQDPEAFDLSPDGRWLYVSNEETAEMSVVDVAAGKVALRVPVGDEPEGVTVSPDGKVVYVTCEDDHTVVAVDTTSLATLGRVIVGLRPRSIAITPDGETLFVTDENSCVDLRGERGATHPRSRRSGCPRPTPPRCRPGRWARCCRRTPSCCSCRTAGPSRCR